MLKSVVVAVVDLDVAVVLKTAVAAAVVVVVGAGAASIVVVVAVVSAAVDVASCHSRDYETLGDEQRQMDDTRLLDVAAHRAA